MNQKYMLSFKIPGASGEAQEVIVPSGLPRQVTGGLNTSGKGFIQTSYQYIFYFAIILAVIFIIFSGVQFITSGGDAERLQDAKKRLFFAVFGLVIVIIAFIIVSAVVKTVGVNPKSFFK